MPVPYSYVDFGTAGDLNSTQIGGTFAPTGLQYVNTTDIYVTVTQVGGAITALTSSQFTVTTSPALQVVIKTAAQGGVDLTATDEVRIGRTTSIDEAARVFSDGSVLKASDLNTQTNQLLYSVQESIDTGGGALPIETDNTYNAGNRRIKNLGTPINESDAVTLSYVTNLKLYDGAEEPQAWSVLRSGMTQSGDNLTFVLNTPTPATAVDSMYLIEIDGVMQVPTTDYTVVYDGGIYTLTLLGANNPVLPASTKITIRNFGVSRNVLSQPYQAGSDTGDALSIERASGSHTGNLIDVEDESGNDLFRVEDDGQVVLGNGATTAVGTASLSTTKLELGSVKNATGAQGSPDSHGALLYNSGDNGLLELQGDKPASGDYAIRVYDWKSDGTNTAVLTATYGGALTISGAATVGALTAVGAFTLTGDAAINGDVTLEAEHKLSVGASGTEVVEEGLNDVQRIKIEPTTTSLDGNVGIVSTNSVPGAIIFNSSGEPSMRIGGDGTGVAHGGAGSIYFTDSSGSRATGPSIKAARGGIEVIGFKIPAGQGGEAGQTGTTPATLALGHKNSAWSDMEEDEVATTKQIDARILELRGGANRGFGLWQLSSSNVAMTTSYVRANLNTPLVQDDPDNLWTYSGSTNDWIVITAGKWLVEYDGIYSDVTSSQSGVNLNLRIQYQDGTGGSPTIAESVTVPFGMTSGGSLALTTVNVGIKAVIDPPSSGNRYIFIEHKKDDSSFNRDVTQLGLATIKFTRID